MWLIKRLLLLITLALTGCTPPVIVEMAVMPATPTTVKIKQLAGDTGSNPTTCNIPCSVKVEHGSNYQVNLDASGYYPVAIKFDWEMAWFTSGGNERTSLVIPLIQRKIVKDELKKSQQ